MDYTFLKDLQYHVATAGTDDNLCLLAAVYTEKIYENITAPYVAGEQYYPQDAIVRHEGIVYIRNCQYSYGTVEAPNTYPGRQFWIPVPKTKDGHRILLSGENSRMHIHKGESVWSKDGTTLYVSDKETGVYDGEYFIEE